MDRYRQARASSRVTGLVAVAALHAVLVYALATGLGHKVIEVARQPLEARIITEARTTPPEPPKVVPPPPKKVPPPFVPRPEVKVQAPPPAAAITAVSETRPLAPPPPAAPAPVAAAEEVKTLPSLDVGRTCRPPQYPALSRRNGESGAVTLKFLIAVDGSVVDSAVDASSGHPRLDEAALAALSLCQFRPGTVNGRPETSWARMRYVWKLN